MKNTTKALIIIISFIITIGSCQKPDYTPTPKIDMGVKSTAMNFVSLPVLDNTTNFYTFKVSVTPGSKYSFQINDIDGDVVTSQGLVADENIESVTMDVSKVNSGIYDLIFIDVNGNELKHPIIIK